MSEYIYELVDTETDVCIATWTFKDVEKEIAAVFMDRTVLDTEGRYSLNEYIN